MYLMAQYKIIVAEDDTVLRDLYLRKFKSDVYDIRTASNGQEALDLVAKEAPDLMLLDINMPVLDGFGVLEKLPKAGRSFPVIPALLSGARLSSLFLEQNTWVDFRAGVADVKAIAGLAQLFGQHFYVALLKFQDCGVPDQVHVGGDGRQQDCMFGQPKIFARSRHLAFRLACSVRRLKAIEQRLRAGHSVTADRGIAI